MKPFKNYSKQIQIWNRSYQFDIEMYNHQQTKFFLLFKHLISIKNDENSSIDIVDVIEELDDYSQTYFQLEEKLMLRTNCPHIEQHILQHQLFLSKVDDFKIAQAYKNTVLLDQMILFMKKWFFMHTSELDKNYQESIKGDFVRLKTKKYS